MKMLVVKGNFAPLNRGEVAAIKDIHQRHKDALIYLIPPQNRTFCRILEKFCQRFKYLKIGDIEGLEKIVLNHDIDFDLDNFYQFYGREDLLCDKDLMQELLKKKLSLKRFKHSLGVADTAATLAKVYHYPVAKAYLAGLLHDVVKEEDIAYLDAYLKAYDPEKLDAPMAVKHSYVAKYYLQEHLNLYDADILNAIYHHTDGTSAAILAQIIYLADKREPGRGIDDDILPLAFNDLGAAFNKLKMNIKEYLSKQE